MITAALCTIGDEILIGQIVDTNSSYIASQLNKIGVKVETIISIKDNESTIIDTLSSLCAKYDIVITTGGLGPTKDDITKEALFKLSGSLSFVESHEQLEIIKEFARKRGMPLLELNRLQASVPDKCKVIPNIKGTAPGMFFNIKNSDRSTLLFSLPGVPYEMEYLLQFVLQLIKKNLNLNEIYHKTIITFGIPESVLSNTIESWELNLPDYIKLAYLPNPLIGIRLRLSIYECEMDKAITEIENQILLLRKILGNAIYGEGDDNLEIVVTRLLQERGKTLSLAESCTGGQIASLLTKIPGVSKVFKGGLVAYNNDVKISKLKVSKETLLKYGAVSEKCAQEMSEGARRLFNSDYSVSVTGIAGPDGGSTDKPVGTAWISFSSENVTISKKVVSTGDRQRNIERVSAEALNFVRLQLIENK